MPFEALLPLSYNADNYVELVGLIEGLKITYFVKVFGKEYFPSRTSPVAPVLVIDIRPDRCLERALDLIRPLGNFRQTP
jgi:hypothetical protein